MNNLKNGLNEHEELDTKSSDAVSDDVMKAGNYNELNNSNSSRTDNSNV